MCDVGIERHVVPCVCMRLPIEGGCGGCCTRLEGDRGELKKGGSQNEETNLKPATEERAPSERAKGVFQREGLCTNSRAPQRPNRRRAAKNDKEMEGARLALSTG